MENADRLTVISIGVGIILAVTTGACSTNTRIADLNGQISELRADVNGRISELRTDLNARFAEINEQRREEHRRIDDRLDRLEDILLKPAAPNAE